jgi:hypothetical protein
LCLTDCPGFKLTCTEDESLIVVVLLLLPPWPKVALNPNEVEPVTPVPKKLIP